MKLLDKISQISTKRLIITGVSIVFLVLLALSGTNAFIVALCAMIIVMSIISSSDKLFILKGIFSIAGAVYATGMISYFIFMFTGDDIVTPFLSMLGAYTLFLALSYSSKSPSFAIRSRWLGAFFAVAISGIAQFLLVLDFGFSQILSAIIASALAALFAVYWFLFGKKSKVITPELADETEIEKYLTAFEENGYEVKRGKDCFTLYDNIEEEEVAILVFTKTALSLQTHDKKRSHIYDGLSFSWENSKKANNAYPWLLNATVTSAYLNLPFVMVHVGAKPIDKSVKNNLHFLPVAKAKQDGSFGYVECNGSNINKAAQIISDVALTIKLG